MNGLEMNGLSSSSLAFKCGEVEFLATKKKAKYVRIPHDTHERELYNLLTNTWELGVPQIVISVTGGARDFSMRSRLTREFQKSLVKAAESTGAWIVTGGTHCGVMKHVGNAIHKHNTTKSQKVIALGIATWGIVTNRDKLKIDDAKKKKPVPYECVDSKSLNKHHTHFILVDDESENKFGREIEFRTKLERYIADRVKKTKVVCVIVQGGPGSLNTVTKALSRATPVVVIAGSGGWANILASLHSQVGHNVSEDKISDLLKENGLSFSNRAELSDWTNMARDCVKQKKLMTIFNMDESDGIEDLDISILRSILNAQTDVDNPMEDHLELALAWNRADIAKNDILTDDRKINDNEVLARTLINAIKQDKPNFIKVLIDYGLSLRGWFNKEVLIDLYKTSCLGGKLRVDDEQDLYKLKKLLLGPRYKSHNPNNSSLNVIEDFDKEGTQGALRELFFFCLVSKKKECARMLWDEMSRESLPAAVVASRVLTGLSKRAHSRDEKDELLSQRDDYRALSYGILTQCFDDDVDKTMTLLKRRLEPWGTLTCLQIAVDSGDIELISHPAVQYFLDEIWYGGIKKAQQSFSRVFWQSCSIYIGAFFFFLIPKIVQFKPSRMNDLSASDSEIGESPTSIDSTSLDIERKEKSYFQKIGCFYTSPIVKFHLAIIFHLLFLTLFGYILLFNFFDTINNFEYALVAWIGLLIFEEIRQITSTPVHGFSGKVLSWWNELGNKLDLLSFVLYFIGFGIRFTIYVDTARVLLCFSFIVFSLRILSMFTVNKQLGPKLLMVQQMVKDLFFFIFILLVFLIAYGVASQSMLYPNEPDAGNVFAGILSKPYWNIFGELFLPEIDYNPTADEFNCTDDRELINQGHRRCPAQNRIVPIISSIYLLLANVLLLNLLIAMFSYTFDKLVDKTDKIWKFQRFALIEEYYLRSPLLIPFSFSRSCCSNRDNAFELTTMDDDRLEKFLFWEHNNKEEYIDRVTEEEKESVPFKVQSINERLEALTSTVADVQNKLVKQRVSNKRIHNLEEELKASNDSLRWIMSALMQQNFVPKNFSGQVHVKARSSPYPQSRIERIPLDDHVVPWNAPLFSYDPPEYTSPSVRPGKGTDKPPWADDEEGHANLPYNRFDDSLNVDRTSHMGRYLVINGLPRNPKGRTGIRGRGLLGRFGPNHAADPIVTRWVRNEFGEREEIDGRDVLQFIAIKREDTKEWALPGGMCDPGENVSNTLSREFDEEVLLSDELNPEEKERIKEKLKRFFRSNGREVYRGYCDDHRNTDNAWIETCAFNFHDHDDSVFKSLRLEAGDGAVKAQWKKVDKSLHLFADHKKYIEKVAQMHNAHF